MKQIVQSARTGELRVRSVPTPKVAPGELLVETRASLISAGTERMVVEFARKNLAGKARARPDLVKKVKDKVKSDGLAATARSVLARLDEPLPLGYSASGRISAVGAGLEGRFRIGQRVAMAGAGIANHAETNLVPTNLAVAVPDGVSDEEACFATLGAIAMHAVRNLDRALGEVVAVIGVGLVGQIAVQLLRLAGIRVVALDYDTERLDLAESMGAELVLDLAQPGAAEAVAALTRGIGCDGVLMAAATKSSEPFSTAALIARDRARLCMVGLSGTEFPYADFMKKELSVVVSRSYGPGRYDADYEERGVKYPPGFVRWTETENMIEVLRLMTPGRAPRLDVGALITHRFEIESAEAAYELVTGQKEPHLGVVLAYGQGEDEKPAPAALPARTAEKKDVCVLGLIGAGNFARTVVLPRLAKRREIELHTVVTRRGLTAAHNQRNFGFAQAETDIAAIFDNPDINAVIVTTRHNSHADLAARALKAGKSVYVEKPLGLTVDEIEQVRAARAGSPGFLQVGFNRRFAALARRARASLSDIAGPKFMLLRVNAGGLAADSWINSPEEGGGRILGEVCHFVDLARFFCASPIASVQADAAGSAEDVTVTLGFADGSLASIAYTGLGDGAYPKERFEIFAGGTVLALDNFRNLVISTGGTEKRHAGRGQDKGHGAALNAFVKAVRSGGPAPIDEAELFETSLATLAILRSLQSGLRVDL